MKYLKSFLPGWVLAAGAAAFALRLGQNLTGFEENTGLAVAGNLPALALIALLIAAFVLFILRSREEPKTDPRPFEDVFSFADGATLLLPVGGIFLMGASGAADFAMSAGILSGALFGVQTHRILGVLGLACAAGLFLVLLSCRKGTALPAPGLLIAPVALVVRLVVTYRSASTDPTLEAYYVEVMALVFLTLAFFRVAGFAFGDANPRAFFRSAPMAVIFAMACVADVNKTTLPALALYLGGAAVLLGLMMAHTPHHTTPAPDTQDEAE